jgi:predicted PurR-regulated permease PerM
MAEELRNQDGPRKRDLRWPRWTPWVLIALATLLLVAALAELLRRIGQVFWPIFVPLLISSVLAYVLDPVVVWFERLGLTRRRAILATLVGATVLVVVFFVFVVPRLAGQFAESARRLPTLVQILLEQIQPALGSLRNVNEGLYQAVNDRLNEYVADPSLLTAPIMEWFRSGTGGFLGFTTSLFEAVLIPFFVYYILRDLPKLRQSVELLIPPRHRTTVHEVFDRVAAVGSNFIRGQFTVCAGMAVLDSVGFLALGVPMPIFLGAVAGFGHLIPSVGPVAAAVLTVSLTALESPEWWRILGVLGVMAAVQTIEAILLTPLILGSRLELHPFWVLAGITIAGHLFGILGMILATPAIAIGKVLLTYLHHAYLHSKFYQGPVPILRPPPPPDKKPPRDDYAEVSDLAGDSSVSSVTGDPA